SDGVAPHRNQAKVLKYPLNELFLSTVSYFEKIAHFFVFGVFTFLKLMDVVIPLIVFRVKIFKYSRNDNEVSISNLLTKNFQYN
ncbi:hypothetical protein COJ37_25570, partial [Bacillus cereus]|uniref:hypothetical protein n=1 Tax=Bacillus cereus TaxID=1396 RepID=UPI000C019635